MPKGNPLSDADLSAWLAEVHPGESPSIRDRRTVPSFHHHVEIVSVGLDTTGPATRLWLRAFQGRVSWWAQADTDLAERERMGYRLAAEAGVPIPLQVAWRTSPAAPAVLLEYVAGEPLWQAADWRRAATEAARLLARLHQRAPPEKSEALADASLPGLLGRLRQWASELHSPWARIAIQVAMDDIADVEGEVAVVLHGDFNPGNVLTRNSSVVAVVDWEEAAIGDPRWDVAAMVESLGRSSPAAEAFLASYQQETGREVMDLSKFLGLRWVRDLIVAEWVGGQFANGRRLATREAAWAAFSVGLESRVADWLASI